LAREFALKILYGILHPPRTDFCTAIFMDGSSARLRRRKLKSLQSRDTVKFYAYENTYRAAICGICAQFIVLKFYFG